MSKDATRLVHLGNHPFDHQGIINPPVYHASTIAFPTLAALRSRVTEDGERKVAYGRKGTPTTFAVEDTVAALHGAAGAIAVSSGLAAVSLSMMSHLGPGDHVLVADSVYAPVRALCAQVLAPLGIQCQFYDPCIGAGIATLLTENTRMVYMESPGSHTFEIMDVPAVMGALKGRELVTVFDNSWATPLYFRPLDHGIDIVIEAATKYHGGHSDVMMGVVSCNERSYRQVRRYRDLVGHCAAPDDLYLVQRGLRTLDIRLARHQENALALARWLQQRDEVARVIHPALPEHPQHALFRRDFRGASGLFSFILRPCEESALAAMLDHLSLFLMGFSWGGYDSLLIPYDINRHRSVVPLTDEGTLMRVHAGLEHVDDLIEDLDRAFARLEAAGGCR